MLHQLKFWEVPLQNVQSRFALQIHIGTEEHKMVKILEALLEKNDVWHKHLHWEADLVLHTQNSFTCDWNMLKVDNSSLRVFEKYLEKSLWVLESHTDILCFDIAMQQKIFNRTSMICLSLLLQNYSLQNSGLKQWFRSFAFKATV